MQNLIRQEQAKAQRQAAEEEIRQTYQMEQDKARIRALQHQQTAKATFLSRVTGKHRRDLEARAEEIATLRKSLSEKQRLADLHRKHVDELIREDNAKLAQKQAL